MFRYRLMLLIIFVAGCAPPMRRAPSPPSPTAEGLAPQSWFSVIVVTKTPPELENWISALETNKKLKLTLAVPHTALAALAEPLKTRVKALLSQGQLELALRIAGDPILPLIEDSHQALTALPQGSTLPKEAFAWPEDVQALLSRSRSQFKRTLEESPKGLVSGGGSISRGVLAMAKKADLEWALAANPSLAKQTMSGLFRGPVACFLSRTVGTKDLKAISKPDLLAEKVLADLKPILSEQGDLPPVIALTVLEEEFLKHSGDNGIDFVHALAEKLSKNPSTALAIPMTILESGALVQAPELPEEALRPSSWQGTLSPWIGEPEENNGWDILNLTRKDLDRYKNSGSASSTSLAQALDSMYAAESGSNFWWLGQDYNTAQDENLERSFRASLTAIYKLMGQNPPEILYKSLAETRSTAVSSAPSLSNSMVSGQNFVRWQDAKGDDRGPGDYFYPSGTIYPAGAWDLDTFEVAAKGEDVVFTITMAELPNPWASPLGFSLPLMDIYMDLNNFTGRGATDLLPERGAFVASKDAWEYCLVVTGWGAYLYRQGMGGLPTKVQAAKVSVESSSKKIHVSLPKSVLGRSPLSWGYLVLVMGYNRSPQEIPRPILVAKDPDGSHFGGAWEGKAAPPLLDILAPSDQSQEELLGAYKQGAAVVLPMVRQD